MSIQEEGGLFIVGKWTQRRYHGLLHGEDLLTVDLPQGASVTFQSHLQTASGLKHTHTHTGKNSLARQSHSP